MHSVFPLEKFIFKPCLVRARRHTLIISAVRLINSSSFSADTRGRRRTSHRTWVRRLHNQPLGARPQCSVPRRAEPSHFLPLHLWISSRTRTITALERRSAIGFPTHVNPRARIPVRHDLTFSLWYADHLCRCRLRLKPVPELFTQRWIQAKLFKELSGAPQRSGRTPQRITRCRMRRGVRSFALTLPLCKESRDMRPCLRRFPWNASHLRAPASLHHLRYRPSSHDSRKVFGSTGLQPHRSAFGLIASPSSSLDFRNVNQPGATPRAGDTSARVHILQQAHQLGNHDQWCGLGCLVRDTIQSCDPCTLC